jgi:hypothetical protein
MMRCGLVADRGCSSCYEDVLKKRLYQYKVTVMRKGKCQWVSTCSLSDGHAVLVRMRGACSALFEKEHQERSTGICAELL